jgi:uncharacterized YigZ family protein
MIIKESQVNTIIIDKSEFITYLKPVFSVEEALDFLSDIRKKHYDATHNCYAYAIGDNMEIQKCSDDGEPSKTAGAPILDVLKKQNVTNIICIVTRYFGGIKLGAGGLVRAYSSSCSEALKKCIFQEKKDYLKINVSIPYDLIGNIERFLRSNTELINTDFSNVVSYDVYILDSYYSEFEKEITNISKGLGIIKILEKEFRYSDII